MSDVNEIANTILREAASAAKVSMARSPGTLYAELHTRIAAALASERAKFAAFAGPDGEPLRVANPLPRTADNCIVVPFVSVVYHPNHPERTLDVDVCNDEVIGQVGVPDESRGTDWYEYPIEECYSTQAAATSALAAAKDKK